MYRRMALNRTIVAVAVVAAVTGQTYRAARPALLSGLVIITLDATRADRLPAYGFGGVATPALDALADRGIVFEDATTVAPLTLVAHTSLFTGLYPPRHGVRDDTGRPFDSAHATLAEILRTHGFRTGGFVGSAVLAADRGLSRGFDVYDDGAKADLPAPHRRDGSVVVDHANAWLRALPADRPFFLWVHLYDVHAPQTLPLEFRRRYGDLYESGIAYADAQVGRLLDTLHERRLLDRTAVVIAGDHGESLGEHGERDHGLFVYESTMHVPLIVAAPGASHRRTSEPTSLVDVLPTVLDLFNIARPQVDGRSAVPALHGAALPDRLIYGESMYPLHLGSSPVRMIRNGRLKYIEGRRPELYDLQTDQAELRDVSPAHLGTTAALAGFLRDFMSTDRDTVSGSDIDLERHRTLSGLGSSSNDSDRLGSCHSPVGPRRSMKGVSLWISDSRVTASSEDISQITFASFMDTPVREAARVCRGGTS